MELNRFNMNDMNKTFNEMTMAYLDVCSNLHILDNINDDIIDNNINKISACINDLLINLQLLKFNIENIQFNEQLPTTEKKHSSSVENTISHTNNEKLVNKTIKDLLPLFMSYMMSIDNNSIINTLSTNTTPPEPIQTPETIQTPEPIKSPVTHNIVDDVD